MQAVQDAGDIIVELFGRQRFMFNFLLNRTGKYNTSGTQRMYCKCGTELFRERRTWTPKLWRIGQNSLRHAQASSDDGKQDVACIYATALQTNEWCFSASVPRQRRKIAGRKYIFTKRRAGIDGRYCAIETLMRWFTLMRSSSATPHRRTSAFRSVFWVLAEYSYTSTHSTVQVQAGMKNSYICLAKPTNFGLTNFS